MLNDPQIGAVAGNVKVYNRSHSLMARMLAVRFVLAFDFLRASQSMYGCVTCTPGALSAYRAVALKPILKQWRTQTFMGLPANIGEDRALTNFVLRQGYHTSYQRSALVHTLVPETYRGLCRMYLRWDRSNFRENWVQLKFIFSRYRVQTPAAAHYRLFHDPDRVPPYLPLPGAAPALISFWLYPIVMVKFLAGLASSPWYGCTTTSTRNGTWTSSTGSSTPTSPSSPSTGCNLTPSSRCATIAG